MRRDEALALEPAQQRIDRPLPDGREAPLAQDRRVDAVSELAELLDRRCRIRVELVQLRPELGVADVLSGEGQLDADRHQPLLGSVVQVALEAEPLAFARLDHAGT